MKKIYSLIISLILGISSMAQQAPDFTLTDVSGTTYNLYQQLNQGKTVVLDFFGVQCGTCQTDIAYLENIWQSYGGPNGNLIIWGIESLGYPTEDVNDFVNSSGGTYPRFALGTNQELLSLYQVTATPSYFVVCSNGMVKPVTVENISGLVDACTTLNMAQKVPVSDRLIAVQFSQNLVNLSYETAAYGEVSFELYDVLGNKIQTKKVNAAKGYHSLSIATSMLRPGFYILRMMRGKELIMAKRLMKN